MNAAIELHDSELDAIVREDGAIVVRLAPAFVHRSVGRPGVDAGTCEAQDATLVFQDGRVEGEIGELPADVFEGALRIGSEERRNMIDLPLPDAPVALRLRIGDDYRWIFVSGTRLTIRLDGAVRFVETFRPAR